MSYMCLLSLLCLDPFAVGAVVYSYNNQFVRVYAGSSSRGAADIVRTGDGWGNGVYATSNALAEIRVLAWRGERQPDYDSGAFTMSASAESFAEVALRDHMGNGVTEPSKLQIRATPQGYVSFTLSCRICIPPTFVDDAARHRLAALSHRVSVRV